MTRVLHIGWTDKFTVSFWRFLTDRLSADGHEFLSRRRFEDAGSDIPRDLETRSFFSWLLRLPVVAYRAEKIILHGMFDPLVLLFLLMQPWLFKKVYWVMWGGDVYFLENRVPGFRTRLHEALRRLAIPRIGHLLTYIGQDVDFLRRRYGARGEVHPCLMYPSNTIRLSVSAAERQTSEPPRVLVGNSALVSNRHDDIFDALRSFREESIEILCPLSYGPAPTVARVTATGRALFGDRFVPLTDFLPENDYLDLLASVDFAVFAHARQQAMGTTIALLGLGKKLFMRPGTPHWHYLKSLNLHIFDFQKFDLVPLSERHRRDNREIIEQHFSSDTLARQWADVFDD